MELTVENLGDHSVFVMTEPTRVDGSKGPYISLGDQHSADVTIKIYPLPSYFVDPNEARVKLERLPGGARHKEVFSISLPLIETMPPYGGTPRRSKIDPKELQVIRAYVGILPDDEGIRDLLTRKPFGPFVKGLEQVSQGEYRGKRLFELQTVYSSPNITLTASTH